MRPTLLFVLLLSTWDLRAQIPSTCFEIESILVDACAEGNNCGSDAAPACQCEGKNEMFRFKIGPDDLDVGDMDVTWANGANPWLGTCQNATTAQVIDDLNATILQCGLLEEPVNGVLPAGADVLMISSTDVCTSANSFAGLADTLVVIFQCQGNYYGHFANYSTGGNTARTLTVDFGPGCEDEVTYHKDELIDINGLPSAMDGAGVDFSWAGVPTYFNTGCNAPVEQQEFSAGADATSCDGTILLDGEAAASFGEISWSGGTGIFSDTSIPDPTYTFGSGDGEEIVLTLTAEGCNGPVSDDVSIFDLSGQLTGISTDGPAAICEGEEVVLTAEGSGGLFEWSTAVFAPSITVSVPGTYTVSVDNACGTSTESITIEETQMPTISLVTVAEADICEGSSIELEAVASGGEIVWSTNETGPTIEVGVAGEYVATVTNDCGAESVEVTVGVIPEPAVIISPAGPVYICEDGEIELTASGEGTFQWNTGEVGPELTVTGTGLVDVTASNICGTATYQVEVLQGGALPVAEIDYADDLSFCAGETIELTGSGGDSYQWNGVDADPTLVVDQSGDYVLSAINECGTDQTTVTIIEEDSPSLTIIGGMTHAICNGSATEVEVDGVGTFTWSDGVIADIRTFTEVGTYEVTATATCGTVTDEVVIVIEDILADLHATPSEGEAPLLVDFSDETIGSVGVSWEFGDGMTGAGPSISHEYSDKGTYEAVMTVSSPLGCLDQRSVFIEVGACPFALFIPSAFTPDGDRLNDQLRLEGTCISRFDWRIYDRWGRELFATSDPEFVWDGADVSGYAVLNGEYPYVVTVLDTEGGTHRFMGTISVIR